MTIIQVNKTLAEFLSKLNTTTLIEERINLMVSDNNVKVILFSNGLFSYEKPFIPQMNHLEEWCFSLSESVEILNSFCSLFKEDVDSGQLVFTDGLIYFTNRISELSLNEEVTLNNSQLYLTINKYIGEDLPF